MLAEARSLLAVRVIGSVAEGYLRLLRERAFFIVTAPLETYLIWLHENLARSWLPLLRQLAHSPLGMLVVSTVVKLDLGTLMVAPAQSKLE